MSYIFIQTITSLSIYRKLNMVLRVAQKDLGQMDRKNNSWHIDKYNKRGDLHLFILINFVYDTIYVIK